MIKTLSAPQHRRPQGNDTGYARTRDLPRLLRLWPEEVRRLGEADQAWLVERLAQMLRAERQLGLARHWSYDLSRHAAVLRAWRAEKAVHELMAARAACGVRAARKQPPSILSRLSTPVRI